MTLSEIRAILAESDIRLTKSLGQNFLHDGNQLRRIVAAGELAPSDQVLEIGPGLGPLTEGLLPECARVLAIEKDGRLVEFLSKRFAVESKLELVHADALDYLKAPEHGDWADWKLVANLPYSVGSPILVELALGARRPAMLVATLQLEVVQRIRAQAGRSEYGVLSLLLQQGYEVAGWFKVPAGCFFPQPDVASACVALRRRPTPLLDAAAQKVFVRLVKLGFGQRRKILFNLLKSAWPEPELSAGFAAWDIDVRVRAEKVTLEQFVGLARELV